MNKLKSRIAYGYIMYSLIQQGMGYIGKRCALLALRKGHKIVAAIDPRENMWGKDVGELVGIGKIGAFVYGTAEEALKYKANVVVNSTVTYFKPVYEQIKPFIEAGLHVVSSCEELAYPWIKYPKLSKELDELATKHDVAVIAGGVNPGYIMDKLPITLCGGCWKVNRIKVTRVFDVSVYREGEFRSWFGTPREKFLMGVKEGRIFRHIGLTESIGILSEALGWKLDNIIDTYEPMISKTRRETAWWGFIEPDTICGWKQTGIGVIEDEAKIILEVYMLVKPIPDEDGTPEQGNYIEIDGEPSMIVTEKGGTAVRGDLCTPGCVVNMIPAVMKTKKHGLLSVKDLPVYPPLPDIKYKSPPEPGYIEEIS
jgi:4-hydroxy-tetrahydrodipicolinate reductase